MALNLFEETYFIQFPSFLNTEMAQVMPSYARGHGIDQFIQVYSCPNTRVKSIISWIYNMIM